jgi:DNA topoisomerase-1
MAKNNKKLVIVESPAKAKTINKILGTNYKVTASVGHIIDLPKTKLGVDIEDDFQPEYKTIPGKSKIITQLKKEASSVSEVLLATDPDREGEAIAYHIANSIASAQKNISRIEFNEITKNAVLKAIENPRPLDLSRVNAQQARRVMDRIVGYQVSPFLWETIYRGLSAGRVQSVALRLLVEREQDISRFQSLEYWNINALLETDKKDRFIAHLYKIDGKTLDPNKFRIETNKTAESHRDILLKSSFQISEIEKKKIVKNPAPAFITSTLQQEASRRFRMTTSRVMGVAQQLYEGINLGPKENVGLITYMRTDSIRISQEAIEKVRKFIALSYGPAYLPAHAVKRAQKGKAQDAHEAIRPTYIDAEYEPKKLKKYLSADQLKIYELIWRRFVASQMKPAEVDKTTVYVKADKYLFRSQGEVITFRGHLIAYEEDPVDPEDKDNGQPELDKIPDNLKVNQNLILVDLNLEQKFTQPPPRYTESTLVKVLDKLGIGRPSTYAQIISTLFLRKYTDRQKRAIIPTELGQTVVKLLIDHFPEIFNVKFTALMEENLDKIEHDDATYLATLKNFYQPFQESLTKVKSQKKQIKEDLQEATEIKCEVCGRPMVIRWGRNGRFYACTGYPGCKNTKPIEEQEVRQIDEVCEKCGSPMQIKRGRFGEFLACSNYPICKNTQPITTGVGCPEENCNGKIVQRQSRKGKVFYSCSNYPKCKFALWDKPVNISCKKCGNPLMVEKYNQTKGSYLFCPSCKYKKEENEEA